jgi:predicted N-formylglutamate amidohydrolase
MKLCDHATNKIPDSVSKTNLGLTSSELRRHIAYDIGAKETAIQLATEINAPLIYTDYSRLVIDPNRSKHDPTSIMQIYDGSIIPGNLRLSKAQIKYRREQFYNPYHAAIKKKLKEKKGKKISACIVSIHSFTPKLTLQDPRPWHIGILWDRDKRMSDLVIQDLQKNKEICIGKNKPYSGNLVGDTLFQHGTSNNIPHVLIELRNDLINSKLGQKKWAKIISEALNNSIEKLIGVK